jgi:hypothetical protein
MQNSSVSIDSLGENQISIRTYLKKVFLPYIGVEAAHQVLEILKYSCGLMLGFALIWNKNLFFEIGSNNKLP